MDVLPQEPSSTFYVGIDFGTCGTGYAVCVSGGEVQVLNCYPGQPLPYCKTMTVLLYRISDWTPVAWGWEACNMFTDMSPAEQQQYLYLDNYDLVYSLQPLCVLLSIVR